MAHELLTSGTLVSQMATLADFTTYMDSVRTALEAGDAESFTLNLALAETVAAELATRGGIDGSDFWFDRMKALKQLKQTGQEVFGSDFQMSTIEFGTQQGTYGTGFNRV